MPFEIRPYCANDLSAIYKICLQTADGGKDASHLFNIKELIGDYYAAPYAVLEPEVCFVVFFNNEACGYIVGCRSSQNFSEQCETDWFPVLRDKYPLNSNSISPLNEHLIELIHDGYKPRPEFKEYPAHLHINLLSNTQGHGLGGKLIKTFIDNLKKLKVSGVHLEVSSDNYGAIAFYEKVGFKVICEFEGSIGYGMSL
ncbi:MAG: GNAT family N-acetyltransferase [Alteromonadales bacterium]|nr:GNAT family N-acetyltransferase [Alteromonadales bacterium]